MHIEQFVMENLNEHRKGILGKTVSIGHMLSWTKVFIIYISYYTVCSFWFCHNAAAEEFI